MMIGRLSGEVYLQNITTPRKGREVVDTTAFKTKQEFNTLF
jgi:hypothetical protein